MFDNVTLTVSPRSCHQGAARKARAVVGDGLYPISIRRENAMKAIPQRHLIAAAFVSVLSISTAQGQRLPTSRVVNSPVGELAFRNGYPSEATVLKLFDDIDFQRASQAYLWALPLMTMHQWQGEQRDKFGAGNLDYVDYFTFTDKLGLLTANATTPYIMAFPNLKESGPLVMEIPPVRPQVASPIFGSVY